MSPEMSGIHYNLAWFLFLVHVSKFRLKLLQFCQMDIWRLEINPIISQTMKNFLIVMQI